MVISIERFLADREPPSSIRADSTVKEALRQMMEKDFSQLPVVDHQGCLVGIISERSIAHYYLHTDGVVPLLDLAVNQCMEHPVTRNPENNLLDLLGDLRDEYAVIIVRDRKPIGIVTDYDTTHFFKDMAQDFMFVRDIELTLRTYIEAIFDTTHSMSAALMRAFRPDHRDPTRPARSYDKLDFGDHIALITNEHNWPKFEPYFGPKPFFQRIMCPAGKSRNQLVHFRGDLDAVQRNALKAALDWLSNRERPPQPAGTIVRPVTVTSENLPKIEAKASKYDRLRDWLRTQAAIANGTASIQVSFADIEMVLGQSLPPTALEHRSWWANDNVGHVQSRAWLHAGWKVADVDFTKQQVTFSRPKSNGISQEEAEEEQSE